jgi:cysteine desulfurase
VNGRVVDFDHNATTRLAAEVRAAMEPFWGERYGNPSSQHGLGRLARDAVESARRQVAALVRARPDEIVFTSGGTESVNLGVRGAARAARAAGRGNHVLASPLEHPAVLGSLDELSQDGFAVTLLAPDERGRIGADAVAAALRDDTVLMTLALANHELGNLYPVASLTAPARARGVLCHSDAVQAAGRVAIDVGALGVDLLSLSAHKMHGPKGVGALYVRADSPFRPLLCGGHQERGRRPGTENVPAVVGFGAAAELASGMLPVWQAHIARLRDRLEQGALALPGARRHGDPEQRVPGTTNLGFCGVDGEIVAIALDLEGVAVSTGAACTSGTVRASPVLRALGLPEARAPEGGRVSLGHDNTAEEVERVLALLPMIVERARRAAGG